LEKLSKLTVIAFQFRSELLTLLLLPGCHVVKDNLDIVININQIYMQQLCTLLELGECALLQEFVHHVLVDL